MRALRGVFAAACLLSAAGCGVFAQKDIDYHRGAEYVPALEIPPGLTRPPSLDTYKVPQPVAGAVSGDVSMQVGENGVNTLLVKDGYDQSWRRVGLAIEALGLQVGDKDRSKGVYYLAAIRAGGSLALPREAVDAPITYRVLVQSNAGTCSVQVFAADGISDDASKVILDALYKKLQS